MKLARIKEGRSKFRVPYKLYEDDEEIPESFILVANDVYEAMFQYMIFQDGIFDFCQDQKQCIIASIEKQPFIFVVDGPFIVEQIPFETKVDVNNGHVLIRGIFAVDKNSLDKYDEMKINFQQKVKEDLIKQIDKQIEDLKEARKFVQ